jgi:hypothetical protein
MKNNIWSIDSGVYEVEIDEKMKKDFKKHYNMELVKQYKAYKNGKYEFDLYHFLVNGEVDKVYNSNELKVKLRKLKINILNENINNCSNRGKQ